MSTKEYAFALSKMKIWIADSLVISSCLLITKTLSDKTRNAMHPLSRCVCGKFDTSRRYKKIFTINILSFCKIYVFARVIFGIR